MKRWANSIFAIALNLTVCASAYAQDRYTVTRLPVEVERIAPVNVVQKEPGHLFADFGQVSFGGLELKMPDAQAGQILNVSLGEAISDPQTINRTPGGSVRFLAVKVALEAGKQTYLVPLTPKDKRLMSDKVGPVMPFRYVEIEGAPAGLDKDHIVQLAAHYSFDNTAAHFESSDQKLNAIWSLCDHTIKATSFGGVFIDGDRERHPYEADAYLNALGWYCCTSDVTLPRYSWQYLIDKPTWPTEWIMFSDLLAWTDYQYTGDLEGLKQFYPDLKAKSLIALERPDGLISTSTPKVPQAVSESIHIKSIRDIVDWPGGERDGYKMRPVNTVVNAFHILALQRMAQIARILSNTEDATRFDTAATHALASFNNKLFDSSTGLYIDGEGSDHSSIHANFFPLAFGLVPKDRQDKVAAFISSHGMACSVYGAQFLLEAMFDHDQADKAIALMTADGDRSWTHMVDKGATMTWEAWDEKFKPNQDWNHAWGAAPANLIPRKLMGIEPLEPGFVKALIHPAECSLQWAEVRVPTIKGSLFVRFDQQSGYKLRVEVPKGMTARIGIPMKAPDGRAILTVDGRPAAATVTAKIAFLDDVQPGKHTIERP